MVKKRTTPPSWQDISITAADGTVVKGSFSVDRSDWMTVRMTGGGSKGARGGPAAETVACLILAELYDAATRARG
jgi:hypothetical protein